MGRLGNFALVVSFWAGMTGVVQAQVVDTEGVSKSDYLEEALPRAQATGEAAPSTPFPGELGGAPLPVSHDAAANAGPTVLVPNFTAVSLEDFASRADPSVRLGALKGAKVERSKREKVAVKASAQARTTTQADLGDLGAATAGSLVAPAASSDIIENLAYALKYDADTIYEYVRDTVDVRPGFGVQKGARGALIEGEGTPHDIAELMHELLLASGYQASAMLGVVDLTPAQVEQFYSLPTDNACAIDVLFTNAQVPHQIGYDSGAPDCNTQLQLLRLQHPYVRVTINGTAYYFDPAHKQHIVKQGLDVRALMQYPAGELRSIAEEGSTRIASDYGVADLNRDGVRQALQDYSVNLIEALRTTAPAASLKDVIGGHEIALQEPCFAERYSQYTNPCLTRQTQLPYRNSSYAQTAYPDGFPVEQRTLVRVSYPGVNQLFTSDFLYDKRLTISANEMLEPELRVDGALLATGNAIPAEQINPLEVEVIHMAYVQTFADQTYSEGLLSGELLNISIGFGFETNARSLAHQQDFAAGIRELETAPDPTSARVSEGVLGPQFAAMGAELMSQVSETARIIDAAADNTSLIHHMVDFTGHRNAAFHNLRMVYTPASKENNGSRSNGAYFMTVMHGSALEGATIEQATAVPAVSTVRLIDLALERGLPTYFAASANFETEVAPNLVNCSNAIQGVRDIIATGKIVFMPADCTQAFERFRGIGFVQLGGGLSTNISGYYNGGYGADLYGEDDWGYEPVQRPRLVRKPKEALDPVDLSSGNFTYSKTDINIGDGDFPSSLSFQRVYSSALGDTPGLIGRGWTHNLDVTVTERADPHQVLGADSPLDAATTIAQVYAIVDTFSTGSVDVVDMSIAMVANAWYAERLEAKNVLYRSSLASTVFTELADGTFNPGPESAMRLTREPDDTYTVTTPQQEVTRFRADGRATEWSNRAGAKVVFGYGGNGRVTSVSNNFGRSLSLTYGPARLTNVSDNAGRSISYVYDAQGNLTSVTDANSSTTTFQYSLPGQLTSFALAEEPTVSQVINTYDGLGRLQSQENADGHTSFLYVAGRRTELVSGSGHRSVDYFGPRGELIASYQDIEQSQQNRWPVKAIRNTYDGRGRVVRIQSTYNPTWEYTYDDATCAQGAKVCTNNIAVAIRKALRLDGALGADPDYVMQFAYDAQYALPTQIVGANGGISNFSYDPATGLLAQALSPAPSAGQARPSTTYTYTSYAASDGGTVLLPEEVIQAVGNGQNVITRFAFDPQNHLAPLSVTNVVSGTDETVTFGYDAIGNLALLDGPRTDVPDLTHFQYDAERQIIGKTDSLGRSKQFARDADGEIVRISAQDGNGWLSSCSNLAPSGKIISESGAGRVADVNDCPLSGPRTITEYNDDGELWQVTAKLAASEGGDRVTRFAYKPSGDLLTVTKAVGSALEQRSVDMNLSLYYGQDIKPAEPFFGYRLPSETNSLGSRQFFEDAHGRTVSYGVFNCDPAYRGANGECNQTFLVETSYDFDIADNLIGTTMRNGAFVSYAYDSLGRLTALDAPERYNDITYSYDMLGRMTAAISGDGTSVSRTYDEVGRVLSETTPVGTVSYVYDEAGNLTRLVWPDGFAIYYTYDVLNRLSEVRESNANGALLATYSYDDLSRRTGLAFGNGTGTSYTYDDEGNLQSLAIDFAQTSADVTWTFDYDTQGSIISQTSTNDAYDYAGHYNVERTYQDDGWDWITKAGAVDFSYDGNGNISGDGTWTFVYDTFNRLKKASVSRGPQANYTYDALGRLYSRFPKSTKDTVKYLYAGEQLIGEYSATGALIRRYVPGSRVDEVLAIYEGSSGSTNRTYLYADRLGSTVAAANDNGVLQSSYAYGPFGEPNSTSGVSLRYTGRPLDPDTGLYYYRARWYSPNIGRFLSPDPTGIADGLHTYAYVANDPMNYTDPSGECALLGAAGGGLLEGGMQAFNRKDRAAYGRAWERLKNWDIRGAWSEAGSQVGEVFESAAVGGATCGLGKFSALGKGGKVSRLAAERGMPGLANEIGILRDAARGKGNFGLGSASAQDAARLGEAWVGKGYTVASDGKTLISADGLRQFRPPSYKPRLGIEQSNFEQRLQPSGQWQSNGHLDIVP